MGTHLSIDEVALSQGELYTFLTNKAGKGKKGTLIASIKESFPESQLVTDRFHVVKLAMDAVQHVRIKQRWEELDKENEAIQKAKEESLKYRVPLLPNGDTPKQLLARSRYILAKKKEQWTINQLTRAEILFDRYPKIKQAYEHVISFRAIYEYNTKQTARDKFLQWIELSQKHEIKQFNTVANTVQYNLDQILNFFDNRNTNANAESFNAKTKLFRANLRGVADVTFFLFRLQKLFA